MTERRDATAVQRRRSAFSRPAPSTHRPRQATAACERACDEPAWEWGAVTRPPCINVNACATAGLGLLHARMHVESKRQSNNSRPEEARAHADSPSHGVRADTRTPGCGSLLAGRYRVCEEIGRGTFSQTHRGVDLFRRCCAPWRHVTPDDPAIATGGAHSPDCVAGFDPRGNVAIKVMRGEFALIGLHEASRLRTVNMFDPTCAYGVIALRDAVACDESVCLVFDLMSPRGLMQLFGHEPGAPPLAAPAPADAHRRMDALRSVAAQLLASLAFFESIGMMHADLKPENVMVELSYARGFPYAAGATPTGACPSPFPRLRVIDFGNAMRATAADTDAYHCDFEVQSLVYRAPEVLWGLPFGTRIDVWSAGCILAELSSGRPLFMAEDRRGVASRMASLLGPLPAEPFAQGMFAGELSPFVAAPDAPPPTMEGHAARIGRLSAALESRDFGFLSFMDALLQPNPALRVSPSRALAHPFLAPLYPFRAALPAGGDTAALRTYGPVGLEWHVDDLRLPVTRAAPPAPNPLPQAPPPSAAGAATDHPVLRVDPSLRGIAGRSRRSLLDFERRVAGGGACVVPSPVAAARVDAVPGGGPPRAEEGGATPEAKRRRLDDVLSPPKASHTPATAAAQRPPSLHRAALRSPPRSGGFAIHRRVESFAQRSTAEMMPPVASSPSGAELTACSPQRANVGILIVDDGDGDTGEVADGAAGRRPLSLIDTASNMYKAVAVEEADDVVLL